MTTVGRILLRWQVFRSGTPNHSFQFHVFGSQIIECPSTAGCRFYTRLADLQWTTAGRVEKLARYQMYRCSGGVKFAGTIGGATFSSRRCGPRGDTGRWVTRAVADWQFPQLGGWISLECGTGWYLSRRVTSWSSGSRWTGMRVWNTHTQNEWVKKRNMETWNNNRIVWLIKWRK